MDPISLAAILASLKAFTATIKKIVALCTDGKEAWSQVQNLFASSPTSKARKSKLTPAQAEFKRIAEKTIRAKNELTRIRNAKIQLDEVHGFGTAARIEKAQEEERLKKKKALRNKRKSDKAFWNKVLYLLTEFSKLILILILCAGAAYAVWINRCVSGNC
jgi:esterase/lipase|tara:strand:- start:47 stop:529 length:483 start_codon:yes stop_codon:yes gene_type:complete